MRATISLAAPVTGPDVPWAADPWEDMHALAPSVPSVAATTPAAPLQQQILKLQQNMDEFRAPRQQVSDLSVIESMVLNDRLRLIACRRMLEGSAAVLLRTVHSYEELKAILLREFGRSRSVEEVYHALRSRRIKAGEGCLRFAIEMQQIAMNAPISKNELVDMIIDGLRDNSTRVSMLYSARTVAELKPLLERYERFRMQAAASKQSLSVKVQPTTAASSFGNKSSSTATSETRCFKPMPEAIRPPNSCFKCGIVGHVHKNCPSRMGTAAATTADAAPDDVGDILNHLQLVVGNWHLSDSNNSNITFNF
ncbi:uncharacterized protein LOC124461910 [Drosophila willistoni]|uniref:uncharacterized protein LOC124461910 n=1 Tax=Drosophila willistoni TaxID=7260 RepID=UPI001F08547C|nr:uncharacterized protein LOC124461910 [Drosophila willistoni]